MPTQPKRRILHQLKALAKFLFPFSDSVLAKADWGFFSFRQLKQRAMNLYRGVLCDEELRMANGELEKRSRPQQALQHSRPWESDVPKVGAVRRHLFIISTFSNSTF